MTAKRQSSAKSGKQGKPAPEEGMTCDEARALASLVCSYLEGHSDRRIADFILLLRWYAYRATDDDRETVYIMTEDYYAGHFDGVDEAIRRELAEQLEALRKHLAGKGGER